MTVEWHGDEVIAAVRRGAFRGVVAGTELVISEATRMITSGPKTGRIYRRRGVSHQASAPGEAPASDTGRLVQSGRAEYDQPNLTGYATWSTRYAPYLEYGTENMEPRPFARPALNNMRDAIRDAIQSAIVAELK
jgi:HK97 gp10 family phage protein